MRLRALLSLAISAIVMVVVLAASTPGAGGDPKPGRGWNTTTTQPPSTTATTATTTPPSDVITLDPSWHYALRTADGCPASTSASHDISDRITLLLNDRTQVPDGSTIQFPANACYRLDKTAKITNRAGLTFVGNGATFQRFARVEPMPTNGYPHWSFIGGSDIAMSNVRVVGLNTTSDIDLASVRASRMFEPEKFGSGFGDRAFEFAFGFQGTKGVTVSNLFADAIYGDGLILGGEHASTHLTTDVTATNITIDRNGRQGVAIISTERVLLDNIKILHSHATGFDLEVIATDGHLNDIEIRNSYVNSYTVAFAHSGVGAHNLYVHDNHVKYTLPSWPWFSVPVQTSYKAYPRSNFRLERNRIDSISEEQVAISLYNITNATIADNVYYLRPQPASRADIIYHAVRLDDAHGTVVIRGNDWSGFKSVWTKDSLSTASVSACGNRLVPGGAFDKPVPC